jgi:hypothetical protein
MDQGEPGLVADRVVAPDFGDVHLVFGRQPARDIDGTGRNIEMEGRSCSPKMGPLRHGFEMVHRLGRFYLNCPREAPRAIRRGQDNVGENLDLADLDRGRLLFTDVRLNLVPALQPCLQEPDDSVVLELFADRPDQDRAHLTSLLGKNRRSQPEVNPEFYPDASNVV